MTIVRPQSIAVAAALVLAVGLAAVPPARAAEAERPTIVVASFGGSLDDAFRKALKPFEDERKVTIRWSPGVPAQNMAKLAATKGAPEFDAILADHVAHHFGTRQGLFAKIDKAVVTNYADLYREALFPDDDGAAFGAFYTGIFFRPEEFAKRGWAPPASWNDLFRPEFCNNIGFLHPNVLFGLHGVLMLAGGDPAKMADGIRRLGTLKDCIATLEPSAPRIEEKLQRGEYLVGINASMRVIPLVKKGYPIRFVIPKEGTQLAFSAIAVARNAPNGRLAQELVNAFLDPRAQKVIMDETFYGPTNRKVAVPDDLKQLGVPDQTLMSTLGRADRATLETQRRAWIQQIERTMAR